MLKQRQCLDMVPGSGFRGLGPELSQTVEKEGTRRPKSANVVWHSSALTADMREKRNGHAAAVVWFTGLSGSGKSTIARLLEEKLYAQGCQTLCLDGDNVRHGLNGDLGFSPPDRNENIRRVAEVAKLAFDHGLLVLCSFISPFRAQRLFARSLFPVGRFLEVYIECDIEELKHRDPKRLYAKALRGELKDFTGVSSPYEEPPSPELAISTDQVGPPEAVERIAAEMIRRGLIKGI